MKLGIFAKTFPGSEPTGVLRAARAAGYESVQYNFACSGLDSLPIVVRPDVASLVRAAGVEAGVSIAAVSATYNMVHPDPARREQGRRSFAAIAEVAGATGSDLLTVCTGTLDPEDQWRAHPGNRDAETWRELCREMALLLEVAERNDLWIGVEPELANVVDSAQRARELIDTMSSDRLRIVLDPANLSESADPNINRQEVEEAVGLLSDRLVIAHAKDRCADGAFTAAGRGIVDFEHFVSRLEDAGFNGHLITHGLVAGEAAEVACFLSSILHRTEVEA